MTERERFERYQQKYPHPHTGFFERPQWSRRHFFQLLGAGVSGYFLSGPFGPIEARAAANVATKNTAKNVIFIFLQGAPSHVDTFDLKVVSGVTPADFNPETINGVLFPTGILSDTAQILDKLAIVRSGLSWALAHNLAQTWFQIGRNPTSALGRIAPHIGSVVAIEKEPERRPDQLFPSFIALNAADAPGSGYFPAALAPFKTVPSANGLANTTHAAGQSRFESRWNLLQSLDEPLRAPDSPLGAAASSMGSFYENARNLMYNPTVSNAFSFSTEDSLRYGDSGFGNACLLAKKIVAADQGTRFIQINLGGWDHHQGIYDRNEVNGRDVGQNIYAQTGQFDPAFAAMIKDLETEGLLDETLVVVAGEFGRTVGALSNTANGRDHYLQMFYLLAGGGVKGGTVIGSTNDTGAFTLDPGWSRYRDVRPEDIEATVYSALGINWTTVRYDDPLGRGFYYVPGSEDDIYGPVNELWG
jgi:uncharacterized protein (DUF1501 family)